MKNEDVDKVLESKARAAPELDAALAANIASSITTSLTPQRPLPPASALIAALLLSSATVAVLGAARAGFYGVVLLGLWAPMVILVTCALLTLAVAASLVSEFIPGSRRYLSPGVLDAAVVLVLLAVFGALFRDLRTDHFFSAGLTCLTTGVLHALPAGLIAWLLVRRGYAVNPISAGLLMGLLGGLAGLTMLELHCTNFQASHVLVWHTAVVPASGAIGGAIAWALSRGAAR